MLIVRKVQDQIFISQNILMSDPCTLYIPSFLFFFSTPRRVYREVRDQTLVLAVYKPNMGCSLAASAVIYLIWFTPDSSAKTAYLYLSATSGL